MTPQILQRVEDFFENYRPREYTKGEIIIFPGDPLSGLYYLSRGSVRQYDISKRGVDLVVNIFVPPAFFPMSLVLNDYTNEYFFNAATPVVVRRAPFDDVLAFIKRENDVALELLARAHRRLDIMMRRQTLMMASSASTRLAYELILSCHSFGERHNDGTYTIRLSETELAARVGLARETVSRQIHELKDRGIVRLTNEHIDVVDLKQLESGLADGP
jgi:CRP-like cAMP-binding protein